MKYLTETETSPLRLIVDALVQLRRSAPPKMTLGWRWPFKARSYRSHVSTESHHQQQSADLEATGNHRDVITDSNPFSHRIAQFCLSYCKSRTDRGWLAEVAAVAVLLPTKRTNKDQRSIWRRRNERRKEERTVVALNVCQTSESQRMDRKT